MEAWRIVDTLRPRLVCFFALRKLAWWFRRSRKLRLPAALGKFHAVENPEMSDNTPERVIKILASVKHIPEASIRLESTLQELGFDSLDTIILLSELEQEFSISIPDESARSVRVVNDIVAGVRAIAAQPKPDPAAPPASSPQTNNG
jgi:acyl carrier protein